MTAKKIYITISLLMFSVAVTLIDAFVHPPYFSKIPIKILFFLLLPLLFFVFFKDEWSSFRSLFRIKKKGIALSLAIGMGIYAVIVGGYFATRGFIDYSGVTSSLTQGMGITADNYIYVAMYISILNSFLEEFFFRGFGFITFKKCINSRLAWFYSPILFAVYHVGMMIGMFHPAVLVLILIALFIGGLIFNFLNAKFDNIYASWFSHMFANFAINTVGAILFGII